MELFKNLVIFESQQAAAKEVEYTISVVNKLYNEWKKTKRRINAVDIVTTTANKISNINPSLIDHIHEATRMKLATLVMRCMDIPPWKPVDSKERLYKKLYPIIDKLQSQDVRTGTGGSLKDIIMTRFSAAVATQSDSPNVFVAYEPTISAKYLRYLFGEKLPEKTFKMGSMRMPDDFEALISILEINHKKAASRFKNDAALN